MFPTKKVVTKLKHIVNARGVINQLAFSAGLVLIVWLVWRHCHSADAFVPKHLRRYLRFPEGYKIPEKQRSESELESLIFKVDKLNNDAEVFNWDRYGGVRESTIMIAIQVHKDVERLQYLIISLGQVHYIQQVLLVFSHSFYDDEINRLIRSITFCKYTQMFFPYSVQLYPNSFPGVDTDDCNGTTLQRECNDRDARRAEHKQHWWWKAHHIFDGLDMKSSRRVVVFLEEDDYVLPDMIYMLRYARRALAYFPSAEVVALGRPQAASLKYNTLLVDTWTPAHARGLALNASVWRRIAAHAAMFCMYDDRSWSASLAHLFAGAADMVACMAPRVLPMRTLHRHSARLGARAAQTVGARAALFPGSVRVVVTVGVAGRVRREWHAPRGNGGWQDLRDQMLCLEARAPTTPDDDDATEPVSEAHRTRNGSRS